MRIPDARVVRERVSIQTKHSFVCFALELQPLSIDISCFEADFSIVELEGRDIAVSVDRHIVGMWWYKWIDHDTVKAAIDLFWDLPEHDLETL